MCGTEGESELRGFWCGSEKGGTFSPNDNLVHNQNLISAKIIITKFDENYEKFHLCFKAKFRS